MDSGGPGRACPVSYRYQASAFAGAPALRADTLWIAGGLYGNPFALRALLELYEREPGSKALVFNGDFHWFDLAHFREIDDEVGRHVALRGNVETEVADPAAGAGCGCGYPEWVGDETVALSNRIIERLKAAARRHPESLRRLAALPMHRVAETGGERIGIVHGDAQSLAGWGFSQEVLATAAGAAAAEQALQQAGVRVFASSHTCLPVLQAFRGGRAIVNNGSSGMPNFRATTFGVATRISVRPSAAALYRARAGVLYVEAIAIPYEFEQWRALFLAEWPEGSEAHRSYYHRIVQGPDYTQAQAVRPLKALTA
jgi:hypothetical protein